jgi:hypothetical protein
MSTLERDRNWKLSRTAASGLRPICYDEAMRNALLAAGFLLCSLIATRTASAQAGNGALDLTARITPTAAKPEPVRQFTFYVLTKSYEDITKDVEANDAPPDRDKFISDLKISDELKEWLKDHDEFDLTSPNLDKMLTPDDILHVPEFLLAYQRANSGGVTYGIPKPKYTDADKTAHPDKYQKQHDEYLAALKKFIASHPESMSGVELELSGINPQAKWALLRTERQKRIQRATPALAQTKYLATQFDTDLDGHGAINLPAGNYWVSTLNLEAGAGDSQLRWDVPITIQNGRSTRLELTNLNAIDAHKKPDADEAHGSSKN